MARWSHTSACRPGEVAGRGRGARYRPSVGSEGRLRRDPIEVESGAQSGDTVRLPGLGVPRLRGGKRGDIIVHLQVETPTKVDAAQRELLEQLARLRGEEFAEGRMENSGGMFSRLRGKLGNLGA